MIVNMVRRRGGRITYNDYAVIIAMWPEGSSCTCTRKVDGRKLTAKDKSGYFEFYLPNPIQEGESEVWEVSCTDGTNVSTKEVTIDTEGWNVLVKLNYPLYLISDGMVNTEFTLSGGTLAPDDGFAIFSSDGNYACLAYVQEDVTLFDRLKIFLERTTPCYTGGAPTPGIHISRSLPSINATSAVVSNILRYTKLSNSPDLSIAGEYELNISDYDGLKYLSFSVSGTRNYTGTLYIKNLWLE